MNTGKLAKYAGTILAPMLVLIFTGCDSENDGKQCIFMPNAGIHACVPRSTVLRPEMLAPNAQANTISLEPAKTMPDGQEKFSGENNLIVLLAMPMSLEELQQQSMQKEHAVRALPQQENGMVVWTRPAGEASTTPGKQTGDILVPATLNSPGFFLCRPPSPQATAREKEQCTAFFALNSGPGAGIIVSFFLPRSDLAGWIKKRKLADAWLKENVSFAGPQVTPSDTQSSKTSPQ